MFRKNWLLGTAIACLAMALSQAPAFADENAYARPAFQMTPLSQTIVPMQQGNCCKKPGCCGLYVWNGSWGPGVYWALPGLHFHRARQVRPD